MRALVIQTSFLGDMVLTTPLIARLAARGVVDVVATPAGASLLAQHPGVRHVFRYDKRGEHAGVRGLRTLARLVRATAPDDIAYLAQGSWRSAALALMAGYRTRIGFDSSAGRWLYTTRVPYRRDRHHAERLWRLASDATDAEPGAAALRPRLYPTAADDAAVEELLRRHGASGEPLIALAPGSVWATKRWPEYTALAQRLATIARLVVVGGSDDRALATAIADATGGTAIDATGALSLLGSAALLARTRVLVTNDSAPQHLASAMNTPTVTLFGPTVPAFGFGPLADASRVVEVAGLSCRPCDAHGPRICPLGHWRCMRELEVDAVVAAVGDVARAGGVR